MKETTAKSVSFYSLLQLYIYTCTCNFLTTLWHPYSKSGQSFQVDTIIAHRIYLLTQNLHKNIQGGKLEWRNIIISII